MIDNIRIKIKGISPLIMHNGEGANPSDPRKLPDFLAKKVGFTMFRDAPTTKKGKSQEDHKNLAEVGFYSSLYLNDKNQVIYPAMCLERMIVEQSKEFKEGRASLATKAKRAVCVPNDAILEYPDKGKPFKELFKNHRYDTLVKVNMAKTPRTRAMFTKWSCIFTVELMSSVMDISTLKEVMVLGKFYGSLERRPKFGRYEVVDFQKIFPKNNG